MSLLFCFSRSRIRRCAFNTSEVEQSSEQRDGWRMVSFGSETRDWDQQCLSIVLLSTPRTSRAPIRRRICDWNTAKTTGSDVLAPAAMCFAARPSLSLMDPTVLPTRCLSISLLTDGMGSGHTGEFHWPISSNSQGLSTQAADQKSFAERGRAGRRTPRIIFTVVSFDCATVWGPVLTYLDTRLRTCLTEDYRDLALTRAKKTRSPLRRVTRVIKISSWVFRRLEALLASNSLVVTS